MGSQCSSGLAPQPRPAYAYGSVMYRRGLLAQPPRQTAEDDDGCIENLMAPVDVVHGTPPSSVAVRTAVNTPTSVRLRLLQPLDPYLRVVPGVGVEPTSPCGRRILSPLRLPISPPRRVRRRRRSARAHSSGARARRARLIGTRTGGTSTCRPPLFSPRVARLLK